MPLTSNYCPEVTFIAQKSPSLPNNQNVRRAVQTKQLRVIVVGVCDMQVGVDLMLGVPLSHVREKSVTLGRLFMRLVDFECFEWGFQLASPHDAAERGSQICFAHPEGYSIMQVKSVHMLSCNYAEPVCLAFSK